MQTEIGISQAICIVIFIFSFGGVLLWLVFWLEKICVPPDDYSFNFDDGEDDDNNQTETDVR